MRKRNSNDFIKNFKNEVRKLKAILTLVLYVLLILLLKSLYEAMIQISKESITYIIFFLALLVVAIILFINKSSNDVFKKITTYAVDLQKARAYAENIVNTIPYPVLILNSDLNVLSANHSFFHFFKTDNANIKGKNLYKLFKSQFKNSKLKNLINDLLLKNISFDSLEIEENFPNIGYRSLKLSGRQIYSEGEGMFLVAFEDVTFQKQIEIQLQQSQKMEAIGTLAGGIAHDFNNLLGVILGCAEILKIDIPKRKVDIHHLEQIITTVNRAKELVNQILTFSRQNIPEKKTVRIGLIVIETLKLLRSTLPTTIKIIQDIKTELSVILADSIQIQQVLINLCTNAAHAMHETGGLLKISLKNFDVEKETIISNQTIEPGSYVNLTVEDTGIGMEPSVLDRIFEPYYTTERKGDGIGMGLAVVHGIIQNHNGKITVESQPKKGTIFNIYIPRIEKELQIEVEETKPFPRGNDRILFVDDEKDLANIGQHILQQLGYSVTIRTSSIEALEVFRAKSDQFDIVITDQTMPNMTGDQLAKELLKIRPNIPIILCTGYSQIISPKKAYNIGIKGFIMKPYVMKDIAAAIRKIMDKNEIVG